MILSKTPYRISFFGGGTDFPDWYNNFGGQVISSSIDKFCYVSVRDLPPFFKHKYRLVYSNTEEIKFLNQIKHPSIKQTLKYLKNKSSLEIQHIGDLPARSGIGSSSAFTVGLLNSLYNLNDFKPSKRRLAENAIFIEQKMIKENVGSQDQIATAFGGMNLIKFKKNNHFTIKKINISKNNIIDFNKNLILVFTGLQRFSSLVEKEKRKLLSKNEKKLHLTQLLVDEFIKLINSKNNNSNEIGKLFHESWEIKKSLSSAVSNRKINQLYNYAIQSGALGGKILGAGGGGFALFYVPYNRQSKFLKKFEKNIIVPFKFENKGSQILYKY